MEACQTISDVFVIRRTPAVNALLVAAGGLLVAIMARISLPLSFSPVPITGQTFGVLLTGALLGSRKGSLALLAYLSAGAAGLPVFAAGGGMGYLLGPTGGYLMGFVPAAFVTGWLAERGWDRRVHTAGLAMIAGSGAIYLCGLSWLRQFVGSDLLLSAGLYPFLVGDLLKIVLAAISLPWGWSILERIRSTADRAY